MIKFTSEQRDMVIRIALATAVLIGCIWVFLVYSQQKSLAGIRSDMDPGAMKWARFWTREAWIERVREELETNKRLITAKEEGMAPRDMIKWFDDTLAGFNSPYQVKITEIATPKIVEAGLLPRFAYKAAEFTVRAVADYNELGRFVRDLENQFPLFRVQDLSIELNREVAKESKPKESQKLKVEMKIVVLVRPGVV